jgi:ABC-type transporter MlaC component
MEDDISGIEQKIIQLKKKKEKLQTQKAILYQKESQVILGEKFSYPLALSVLSNSWKSASDKQKEEWTKSADSFRKKFSKQKSKRNSTSANKNPQTPTENP